jgi:hypothetical protein
MNKGTQIAYIPHHAHGDISHPDVEFGFVMKKHGDCHYCRFWRKGNLGELRTIANSECAPTENLSEYKSVSQDIVDNFIRLIEIGFYDRPLEEGDY